MTSSGNRPAKSDHTPATTRVSPRTTRLVRVADLRGFRTALVALATGGDPLDARERLIVVPTHAAAAHLIRTIEHAVLDRSASVMLPELVTARELVGRLAERLEDGVAPLSEAEREVLLGVACRTAAGDTPPPFRLRPGLIAEILRLYDALQLNQKDVDTFERLALGMLEPGAAYDRGAERLVRQTRFLAAAFRNFEARCHTVGPDEHVLRRQLTAAAAGRPYRHVVVAVGDRAFDPYGLMPAQWDLLARLPALEQLDVVVTDTVLAGAFHEHIHRVLPGIDEVRLEAPRVESMPTLVVPSTGQLLHVARDREEEVAGFARRVKAAVRTGELGALGRSALVVKKPLPYVYVAREVVRSAGIPCQMFDALPLASEPYAAALDLVCSCVAADFARAPMVAMLTSPHFNCLESPELTAKDLVAVDHTLVESGYLGGLESLERLVGAGKAGKRAVQLAGELAPLRSPAAVSDHLRHLTAFLVGHERAPASDDALRARHLRARGAVLETLDRLRDAYARFDDEPVEFEQVTALVRRWIEGQTFSPLTGDSGVHLVDAESARFGDFDVVQLAGLVDGEWPDHPRRNIFYSPGILRELGWPAESERLDGARAAFADLCRLPSARLIASAFSLESDSLVSLSPLADEIERVGLDAVEELPLRQPIFEYEALRLEPPDTRALGQPAQAWAALRDSTHATERRSRGQTAPSQLTAFSVGALERYQDCPFKFFASEVLRLSETPEDEPSLSPRARGRFIHELFEQFFRAWDARHRGPITVDNIDAARSVLRDVAEPLLGRLGETDAALERTRLFGSAISVGMADVVLGIEATRGADVRERWLEHRLEGEFTLGSDDGRTVSLRGVADRVDLLSGNRLRVVDYKSGSAPNPRRALQVPIYALCARERLTAATGEPWSVDAANYIAFTGKRALVPIVKAAADSDEVLADARSRLWSAVDGIGRGEFPPRPHDPTMCRYCAFAPVCRKDYVGDE